MADDPTEEEELTLEAQEAGFAFRAEMWMTDTLLGYWMYVVGAIAIVLGLVFFYGQYTAYQANQQRAYAKSVTLIENQLDSPVAQIAYLEASGQDVDKASLAEQAAALEAIGATGAAQCEALLKAAELYRVAGKVEDQRRVFEGVIAVGIQPFTFLAESGIANLDLEAGNNDAAIARLKPLTQNPTYLGEQASLDLGMIHEHLGQTAEARGLYESFLERYLESPRTELVTKRLAALKEG